METTGNVTLRHGDNDDDTDPEPAIPNMKDHSRETKNNARNRPQATGATKAQRQGTTTNNTDLDEEEDKAEELHAPLPNTTSCGKAGSTRQQHMDTPQMHNPAPP